MQDMPVWCSNVERSSCTPSVAPGRQLGDQETLPERGTRPKPTGQPAPKSRRISQNGLRRCLHRPFCDILRDLRVQANGFKDMCKGKDPTEVLELLDVVLEGVNQALEQNGGTLLEFIGDEVSGAGGMASWISGGGGVAMSLKWGSRKDDL
eukprot:Skav200790  [mRNA]  locus=scaffold318:100153:102189:- [translate_table: standard]